MGAWRRSEADPVPWLAFSAASWETTLIKLSSNRSSEKHYEIFNYRFRQYRSGPGQGVCPQRHRSIRCDHSRPEKLCIRCRLLPAYDDGDGVTAAFNLN